MATLDTETRNQLAKTIQAARKHAEEGARRALEALAVGANEPHSMLSAGHRELRVRLRSHGRQLGDARDAARGTQSITRLSHEVAYEHWHRMLFARFLAENNLLVEWESGVAISMEECRDIAREQKEDPWVVAARLAQRMLPEIFKAGDPSLEVELPRETRVALERLVDSLPPRVFLSDDALGWTYQFWQTEKKAEVNDSGVKIGADEISAVTQLFTEPYMVHFLLHNTVGAWRASKMLQDRPELATAEHEDELRRVVSVRAAGGYDFNFLRFVREAHNDEARPRWAVAAGDFPGWPELTKDLRVIDPCCGSGHFLVESLRLLVALRMEEEGLTTADAICAVLRDNLFGLEIDPRCTQLAAFAVAFSAWRMAGTPIELPVLNIACSGVAPNAKLDDWVALAGNDSRLQGGMARVHELFDQAPVLGSLIDPRTIGSRLHEANFAEIQPHLKRVLERESVGVDQIEHAVAAHGIARAAELLAGKYTLVITNVPYLGRGKQDEKLSGYIGTHFAEGKADLATAFALRCLDFCVHAGGSTALVTPQNWLFLPTYEKLRETLLARREWDCVARLGTGAFETIGGEVVSVALVVLSSSAAGRTHMMAGVDVSTLEGRATSALEKAAMLQGDATAEIRLISQASQRKNPNSKILFDNDSNSRRLGDYVETTEGLSTGDLPRVIRQFWEIEQFDDTWEPLFGRLDHTLEFGARDRAIHWSNGEGPMRELPGARFTGLGAFGRQGILIRQMGSLPATRYCGEKFDDNSAVLIPKRAEHLPALWCFVADEEFPRAVRKIDQALKVTSSSLLAVPFNLAYWQQVADERYPTGLQAPSSNSPDQWLFHGRPEQARAETILQVAVARLVGFRWPAEYDSTLLPSEAARKLVAQCADLTEFVDRDGIVCLDPIRGEDSAADRVRRLLAAAYGQAWTGARERELLSSAGGKSTTIDEWLRNEFFEQHCKLFLHRPYVLHLWDGRRDGFNALVNYHKLAGPEGRRTLEAITYGYLGDWLTRQREQQQSGVEGSDARVASAIELQRELVKILDGEAPYDIFVRWKPLHAQPIGWEPDLADGVRMNIRPFMTAELSAGRKGAGLLRWKPNIKWEKDRGCESQRPRDQFPWFWGLPKNVREGELMDFSGTSIFDGNRWNDLHYTKAAKQAARERHASRGGVR